MGVAAKDATKAVQTFKTSTDGGELVVHHNVDTVIAGTGATSLGKAEDAAHASGDTGVAVLAVRRDAAAAGSGTDGDYSTVNVDAAGKLWVTGTALEDDAHATGDKGHVLLARRKDTPAVSSGTDGDYSTVDVNADGALWTAPIASTRGGCSVARSLDLNTGKLAVKASAGSLYGIQGYNAAAAVRYVKLYDATSAGTTIGTTTPVMTIAVEAQKTFEFMPAMPVAFSTAITAAATTGAGDSDTTAPAGNDIIANFLYR